MDNSGRNLLSFSTSQSGAIVGGNPEAQSYHYTMNGGYGWQRVYNTTINSPPGINFAGDVSGASITNRCSATSKREIGIAPIPSLLDALNVTTYKLVQPPAMDEDGITLAVQPAITPYCEQTRVGFIAEDLAANPLTRPLVNNPDSPEDMGIDLGQLCALLTVELQRLQQRVHDLENEV